MYNTLQVLRAHLAAHQKCEAKKISNEKLFYDVKRQLVSVSELVAVTACLTCWAKRRQRTNCGITCGRIGRDVEQSLVESPEFAWRWAQEGKNACARQSYVDLPGSSASKNVNRAWYHLHLGRP